MPTSYFALSPAEQRDLLGSAASSTGRAPKVIEKDIWLSLVLQHLFAMPDRKAMAFKGGTSLSKVYSVIQRFSEDVDVTIDYRQLGCQTPIAELKQLSGATRDKIGAQLKAQVARYINEAVQPHLMSTLKALGCDVTVNADGEEIRVYYPSQVDDPSAYMREFVLIEFGGRNLIKPNEVHTLQPDIVAAFPGVSFPKAEGVVVLAPERTFWEKVTLIHAQCNRAIAQGKERVSRHWYDLAMLAQHEIGKRAVADLGLLADVVDLKTTFYRSATAHYDRCLAGALLLVPDAENRARLNTDYQMMQAAGMLNGHVYPLAQILDELAALQAHINRKTNPAGT